MLGDSEVDIREGLAEDILLLHPAGETSAAVTLSPRRPAGTSAETSIAGMSMAEAARFTAVAVTTAAEDITAPALDSVSAFTRLTGTPPPSAIPPDSMMQMASGNTIRVALCHTDIRLDERGRTP